MSLQVPEADLGTCRPPAPAFLARLVAAAGGSEETALEAADHERYEVPADASWQTLLESRLASPPAVFRSASLDVDGAVVAARRGAPLAIWRGEDRGEWVAD